MNNTPHASTTRYRVMKGTNTRNINPNRKTQTTPARTAGAAANINRDTNCQTAASLNVVLLAVAMLRLVFVYWT